MHCRLTHHSQLVTIWEQSGKDWVRDLELINPIMRTKVSDVDPRFIRVRAWPHAAPLVCPFALLRGHPVVGTLRS